MATSSEAAASADLACGLWKKGVYLGKATTEILTQEADANVASTYIEEDSSAISSWHSFDSYTDTKYKAADVFYLSQPQLNCGKLQTIN